MIRKSIMNFRGTGLVIRAYPLSEPVINIHPLLSFSSYSHNNTREKCLGHGIFPHQNEHRAL